MHDRATNLITLLGLEPHPEGGFFGEIFRSASTVHPADRRPSRAAMTAIYYLLAEGQYSRWHSVASDEQWTFVDGDPLDLFVADRDGGSLARLAVGPLALGLQPVVVVPAGYWQAARPTGGHSLVTCTVGPGFEFDDFRFLAGDPEEERRLSPKLGDLTTLL